MKRSGGVSAASVLLIVASVLVTFGAFFAVLGSMLLQSVGPKLSAHAFARELGGAIAVLLIAVWGIVTGVGLLRLRRWAWFSALAISGLLVADALHVVFDARKFIRATTGIPTSAGHFVAVEYLGLALATFGPLGLGVWWLIAFLRPSGRAQFAPGVILERAAPPVFAQPAPVAFTSPAPAIAEPIPHTSPRLQLSYRRPVSITVIAVLLLAGVASFPFLFFIPPNMRLTAMFGAVLSGRNFLLVMIAYAAAAVAFGIGLLRLKEWARLGAILYCAAGILNAVMTAPHMDRLFDAMHKSMNLPVPEIPAAFMRLMAIVGLIFGVGINLAGIYFLVTRAAAFQPPRIASARATHTGLAP